MKDDFPYVHFFTSLYLSDFQLYAEKVATRGLCAIAQAESLRYKLIGGLAVRRYVQHLIYCTVNIHLT